MPNKSFTFKEAVETYPHMDVWADIIWDEKKPDDFRKYPRTLFIYAVVTDAESKETIARMLVKSGKGMMYFIPDAVNPKDRTPFAGAYAVGGFPA